MSLEQSIAAMIARYDTMADQVDAARAEIAALRAEASPGLQSPVGLAANQLGIDNDGDGKPDGWPIWTHPLATWSLADTLPLGDPAIVAAPGTFAHEFYTSIPGNPGLPHWCDKPLHFWRVSWDVSATQDPPAMLKLLDMPKAPSTGMSACWIKHESGDLTGATADPTWGRWIMGRNGWSIFALSGFDQPYSVGNYRHAKLTLNLTKAPAGSLILTGPQSINARIDPAQVGWNLFPGLNKSAGQYTIEYDTRMWE